MSEFISKTFYGAYPSTRLRRNRSYDWIRNLTSETIVSPNDFIWPVFIRDHDVLPTIQRMPDVQRYTLNEIIEAVGPAVELGLNAVALFPVISNQKRSENVQEIFAENNFLYQAIGLLRKHYPQLGIITDPALDSYTSHGHDGLYINDDVDNDESVKIIAQHALMQAQAGAHIVSPSDMMDGRVKSIRTLLDQQGFQHVGIMSYAAKYATHFYGPFREALGSDQCLKKGHKKTYQMNPANSKEALREVALDLAEGADMILIKPGLPYLDIVRQVKDHFCVPTFAFHVSGEYSMLKAASRLDMICYSSALMESMICFKRAGADGIITYGAIEALKILKKG